MKEIVIISGKGGTGKTSVTASFAYLAGKDIVVADCDVDAADMHLLMKPDFAKSENFYSGLVAHIDQEACIQCGDCADVCRFEAIPIIDNKYVVAPLNCEGCGYCARICPAEAISNHIVQQGQWFISSTKTGSSMVHAKLGIGADNSGKLVAKVKNEAKQIARDHNKELIIVDGSPGVGCPVVSSLSGATFVVIVTEPSVSGLHDLKRVHQLIDKFHIATGCIINKADINTEVSQEIRNFLEAKNIMHITNIPYDEQFTKAMTQGKTIVEYDHSGLKNILEVSWKKIKQTIIS